MRQDAKPITEFFIQARSSTIEPKNDSGSEGKKDCSAVARKDFAICGQKMRARNLAGVR
jgi:hypothetical protein